MSDLMATPEQLTVIKEILTKCAPNIQAFAFGSRVTGTARHQSDLDIMLFSETPVSLLTLGDIREAFMESDLPFRVDIVDSARATDEFKKIALTQNTRIV